jgi:hypothetical protein
MWRVPPKGEANFFRRRSNGSFDTAAEREAYALARITTLERTSHRDDLHLTPIFDQVSLDFIRQYVRTKTWCREAMDAGWEFACLPSVGINPTGVTIQ